MTKRLSNDLHAEVSIRHVDIALFNRLNLEGTLVRDLNKDTLLYADQLKLRITDWFFLKDELVLKYVGLEDAHVNMYRKDSVWNYQFLVNYFSPAQKKEKKKSPLKLDLKKLDFKNISILQKDDWLGSMMEAKVTNLQLEAEKFNLDSSRFDIKELELDKPYYVTTSYSALRPPVEKKSKPKADTGLYFNSGNVALTVQTLIIRNGVFGERKQTDAPPSSYFDASNLRFEKITGRLTDVSFIRDTIKANIDLSTRERCGLDVRKLKARFKLTPQIMEFAKFELQTPQTRLQNYYAMHFTDFNKDFGDYVEKVVMEARFTNAEVHSNDIAHFAPALKTWNKSINISGYGKGTVGDLNLRNMLIRAGANTVVSGDLAMKGLPKMSTTIIDFRNGFIQTNYRDGVMFMPSLAKVENPSLSSLGEVKFSGNFNGTISKFATQGVFNTALGGLHTNITMTLPHNAPAVYSGHLVTERFNIGKFLRIKDMGTMSFDGSVQGVGLMMDNLKATVNGKISQLAFKDYDYRRIDVEGTFQKKQFEGTIKLDDENLDLYTTLKMDLRGAQPHFNVLGDLHESDFRNLHLANRQLQITGLFDLDFTSSNIDNFLGYAKVYNANLLQDSVRLNFDSLILSQKFNGDRRNITLSSNEFDASIEGKYNVLDLPNTFQTFLHQYYPAYISKPRNVVKNQEFNFIVSTKNIEGYLALFTKDVKGLSNSSIAGTINMKDTMFELNADVPEFAFKNTRFVNTSIEGRGNLDALDLKGNIENIWTSDSSGFPNTVVEIRSKEDLSHVVLRTRATNTLNELNLVANVTTYPDGVKVNFDSSNFVINDKRWLLEEKGELIIRKNLVSAENIRFTQNEQHIDVKTITDEEFDQHSLQVNLTNLNLADFAPFITKNPRLEGVVSGQAVLKDLFGNLRLQTDLTAERFWLDADSIGVVKISGNYSSNTRKVGFTVVSDNEAYRFAGDGTYDLANTSAPLLTNIKLNNTKVTILNRFLNTIFTDITGYATGTLHINGNPSRPQLLGQVALSRANMLVNFTKVQYFVDTATFVFTEDAIDFGTFNIKDKFGNVGVVGGKLYQQQLRNMRFAIDISTKRMLLIDTKSNDNPQFYGTAIGRATMSITGRQEDMHIGITAAPVDSSHIFIPTATTKESGQADFIVFKQYGTEMKEETATSATNVTVDLDLTANPLAKIDVILDPLTGDIIKAIGNGRLRIHAGTTDDLTINGRYEIQSGSYDFNFQSFIKKPFILRENAGSFIEWSGDPYNANIQVEAQYVAEHVRLNDLVGTQNIGGTVQSYQGDVYVIADITGNLSHPTIKFKLDFPIGAPVKSDETFTQFLAKIERDDNEMLKQVTYLIVFGSFAPYGESSRLGQNFTSLGINTISELISKKINDVVSDILYKWTGDRSWQFDLSGSVYNSNDLFNGNVAANNALDRTKVNLKIGKSLFKGTVNVTIGGDLDVRTGANSSTSQQLGNYNWLPDLTVEFILSKDRKIRGIIFSRNNLDITSGVVGRRNRQGVSLSYRKDFRGFALKKRKKQDQPTSALPPPPAVLTKNDEEK